VKHFDRMARAMSDWVGSAWAFYLAVATIVGWALTGSYFHYSDTWQLVINTSTTVVTYLIVFLIQATQNRDQMALQLKLDELIRAVAEARNSFRGIEKLSEADLRKLSDA
jgi:low affinity Fe/Cu permease